MGGAVPAAAHKRPVELVLRDVKTGMVSKESARKDYGLRFTRNGTLDKAATTKARKALAKDK